MIKRLILLASALSLAACAGQSKYPENPISGNTRVQVVTPQELVKGPNAKTGGGTAGEDALKGAGAGAVYGAAGGAMAGVGCGPLLVICSPVMAVVGAGTGLVLGGVAGSIHGSLRGLPKEKAEAFEAVVADVFEQESPTQTVQRQFKEDGGHVWSIVDTDPSTQVFLTIESFRVEQDRKENLKVILTTGMVLATGPEFDKPTRKYKYQASTAFHHIDAWLADDGALIRQELELILRDSAFKMFDSVMP